MTTVFHRAPRAKLPIAVAGDGIEIIDSEGKRYIDASGGAAVSCLGHSNQRVIDAIKRQAQQLPYAHTSFFTTAVAEELSDRLIADAPEGLGHVYFTSGGSEAIEAALKLARQYFVEKGQGQRRHFIARRQSYHGNTLGALAIGGNAWRREPFLPILIEAHHVSPCYAYREQRADETEEAFAQRLADELEAKIFELGGDTVAAFVAETVVGATAGAVPPVSEYFKKIRAVCNKYGVLLILDEIMCGMGRTGHLYACAEDGVTPDLLTIAKGLGAGYQAIGATLVSSSMGTRTSATRRLVRRRWKSSALLRTTSCWTMCTREASSFVDCFARTMRVIRTLAISAAAACLSASSWYKTGHQRIRSMPARNYTQ
jgi:adenosylmethionine-8-amino-7-oxononanoate aminotransferase